jgi:hypothetical protein
MMNFLPEFEDPLMSDPDDIPLGFLGLNNCCNSVKPKV